MSEIWRAEPRIHFTCRAILKYSRLETRTGLQRKWSVSISNTAREGGGDLLCYRHNVSTRFSSLCCTSEDILTLNLQAKNVAKKMPIWERGVKRRKNFKTLLAEDEDDSDFYEKLRKRDADKILVNGHSKGTPLYSTQSLKS